MQNTLINIDKQSNGTISYKCLPVRVGCYEAKLLNQNGKTSLKLYFDIIKCDTFNDDENWSDYLIYSYGNGLIFGECNTECEIFLITQYKSIYDLVVIIEGPSKVECKCEKQSNGNFKINYYPKLSGEYLITFKLNNKILFGSPFTAKISSKESIEELNKENFTTSQTLRIEELEVVEKANICSFTIKLPNTNPFDLSCFLKTPTRLDDDCDCLGMNDYNYRVSFEPKENGKQTLSILDQDMHINGSPFEYTIGSEVDGGAHKVKLIGPYFFNSEINKPIYFNIYVKEAGSGLLEVLVHGCSKANLIAIDQKDGLCLAEITCEESGYYKISILFNGEHIIDSPFELYINPPIADGSRVTTHNLETENLIVGNQYSFIMNLNRAVGNLDSYIIDPFRNRHELQIINVSEQRYEVSFKAIINGFHWLFTRFNQTLLPSNPHRLTIGDCKANPGQITLSGLQKEGETDEEFTFIINSLNAGAGKFNILVEGLEKVEFDYKELQEGYLVSFIAYEPGDYMVSIKFFGLHVASSPFKVKINGPSRIEDDLKSNSTLKKIPIVYSLCKQVTELVIDANEKALSSAQLQLIQIMQRSDASKVRLKGSGLTKAFRNQKAQFTVDARDAGTNILYVGVYGVKTKCDEIITKYMGNNQYQVSYCIKGKGNSNVLVVKYGDEHVTGSPFHVELI